MDFVPTLDMDERPMKGFCADCKEFAQEIAIVEDLDEVCRPCFGKRYGDR